MDAKIKPKITLRPLNENSASVGRSNVGGPQQAREKIDRNNICWYYL